MKHCYSCFWCLCCEGIASCGYCYINGKNRISVLACVVKYLLCFYCKFADALNWSSIQRVHYPESSRTHWPKKGNRVLKHLFNNKTSQCLLFIIMYTLQWFCKLQILLKQIQRWVWKKKKKSCFFQQNACVRVNIWINWC